MAAFDSRVWPGTNTPPVPYLGNPPGHPKQFRVEYHGICWFVGSRAAGNQSAGEWRGNLWVFRPASRSGPTPVVEGRRGVGGVAGPKMTPPADNTNSCRAGGLELTTQPQLHLLETWLIATATIALWHRRCQQRTHLQGTNKRTNLRV